MKIGLLGGSFNPPHDGHRHISLIAMKKLGLDRIWWIVSPGNPLKSHHDLLPMEERLLLGASCANHPRIDVTDFEMIRNKPYTYETLKYLLSRYPSVNFVWIMGADNLSSFHRWKHWRRLAHIIPIIVIDRPSYRYDLLSSRFAISQSDSLIKEEKAAYFLTKKRKFWTLINGKLSAISSTDIRKARKNNEKSSNI